MKLRLLIPALVLIAAALGLGWWAFDRLPQQAAPPTPVSFDVPPASGPESGGCYYTWATDPLPELTKSVQAAIREIQPKAEARAEAFGENCTYSDGRVEFLTMETDYHVTLQAEDLNDHAELGGLVRRTMDLLAARFPSDQTPGPQPGRVNFLFRSASEEQRLVVEETAYKALPAGLSDSELLEAFLR